MPRCRFKEAELDKQTIEAPRMAFRLAEIERMAPSGEDDRTIDLSFSSEEPHRRWWGVEVLGHKKGEVDMGFVGSGRAPFLVDHDRSVDSQIGVVEKAWVEGGRGRARVRLGKSARAEEFLARIRDGELGNISVGYEITRLRLESEAAGVETYRVTAWKPHEISLVTVPADESVGVGRAAENLQTFEIERIKTMTAPVTTPAAPVPAPAPTVEINKDQILADERTRIAEINAVGAKFNMRDKAEQAIRSGMSVSAFNGAVLESLGSDAETKMRAAAAIGLSEKEVKRYSFMKVVRALANPTDRRAQEAAKFELEAHDAAQKAYGREARGVLVPNDVLVAPQVRATLTYGTAATAGNLVETKLDAASFIDVLRNSMTVKALGARILGDLVGDLDIPRKSAATAAAWVAAEGNDAAESNFTIDLVSFRQKTIAAYTAVTRKMMSQSSLDVENLVRDDIAMAIALGIDLASLHGSGSSGQPTGIASTSGIGSIAGGTNGLAPAWSHVVGLETEVSVDNADIGALAYLTNAKVRGKLKQTEKASSTGQFIWPENNQMNGYRSEVSNQVSSALTKGTSSGVCSAIFFGNWSDLMIAFWSGVDILVDPYTAGLSGGVRVIAHQDCDVQVRHPQSFAAMLDALTT